MMILTWDVPFTIAAASVGRWLQLLVARCVYADLRKGMCMLLLQAVGSSLMFTLHL
jgi:hypothetical protein